MTTTTHASTKPATAVEVAWAERQKADRAEFEVAFAADLKAKEQAAAQEAAAAEEHAKLEADRADKLAALDVAINDFHAMLSDLVASVRAALAVSNEAYNAGMALGVSGNMLGTRNYIESRIGHVLNLEAGLKQFDLARGTGRDLWGAATSAVPVIPQAKPLPDRRDERDIESGYAGQNPASLPILRTWLKNAAGEWVEVPIGSSEFPAEPYVAPTPRDSAVYGPADEVTTADREAETLARQARHRKEDAEARKRGQAAARILVPGEGRTER
jgi:hypothetical protein